MSLSQAPNVFTAPAVLREEDLPKVRSQPLYQQVVESIEAGLSRRVWTTEAPLPSEAELACLFGVSVGTVRKAVDVLVDRGHLVRRQGAGTYVRRYCDAGYWNRFQRFQTSDRRIIRWTFKLHCLERIPASAEVARVLGVNVGDEVIHVVREVCPEAFEGAPQPAQFAGKSFDQSWLPVDLFHALRPEHYSRLTGSLYALYEEATGVIVTNVSDRLEVVMTLPHPMAPKQILTGPFFKLHRTSRTFGGRVVEMRLETPPCLGLSVTFDE